MKKKIQFSLVYRDMWQSSGKFQPRKDQLAKIAPVIIEMGCFSRVETNGGAFEQVNLLAGENPNDAVRAFCKPFNEVGIKTHMLDRGLNALRMYPVPDDVRALMYKVKAKQGTNITRIFDGLNDVRNIIPSIKWAKEGGMTPQCALCITNSPVHTLEYYMNIADQLIAAGAEEICLKDMAGIGQPAFLGKLTKMIKDKYPEIIIQYHGHSGPGLSMASILEVCNNGADIIDTAIEPLSWGSATSAGWDWNDKAIELTKVNKYTYSAEMELKAGELKFMLGGRNWDGVQAWLMAATPGASLSETAAEVVSRADGDAHDYKWSVSAVEAAINQACTPSQLRPPSINLSSPAFNSISAE
jgi:pyruvate/oxaloacetate carboxyltransferase